MLNFLPFSFTSSIRTLTHSSSICTWRFSMKSLTVYFVFTLYLYITFKICALILNELDSLLMPKPQVITIKTASCCGICENSTLVLLEVFCSWLLTGQKCLVHPLLIDSIFSSHWTSPSNSSIKFPLHGTSCERSFRSCFCLLWNLKSSFYTPVPQTSLE